MNNLQDVCDRIDHVISQGLLLSDGWFSRDSEDRHRYSLSALIAVSAQDGQNDLPEWFQELTKFLATYEAIGIHKKWRESVARFTALLRRTAELDARIDWSNIAHESVALITSKVLSDHDERHQNNPQLKLIADIRHTMGLDNHAARREIVNIVQEAKTIVLSDDAAYIANFAASIAYLLRHYPQGFAGTAPYPENLNRKTLYFLFNKTVGICSDRIFKGNHYQHQIDLVNRFYSIWETEINRTCKK